MKNRVATMAVVLAVATAACSSSGGGPVDAGTSPTRPPTTTTTGGGTTDVQLFFTRGEKVVGVTRAVPKVTRIGAETVKALVGGPTTAERDEGYATAIPPETRFRDLAISDGVARVDLSGDFESGGGSLSLSLRLAQVVCTVDQFDSVSGVRFMLDGKLVDVFSGNGIVLDQPVSCSDYAEFVDGAAPVPATFPGIWPFVSQAEMDAYLSGADRSFTDPVETARLFGSWYLGMVSPATFGSPTPVAGGRLEVKLGFTTGEGGNPIADPQPTMSVFLMSGDADGDLGPWTVVGATSPNIVVTAPTTLQTISSPTALRGQATAFEGTVGVEVREDPTVEGTDFEMADGRVLGTSFVTGRGDGILGDFAGEVAFDPPTRSAGAVIFQERSAADGVGVLRATVVKVAF